MKFCENKSEGYRCRFPFGHAGECSFHINSGERAYTHAEMLANQAAAVREAAQKAPCNLCDAGYLPSELMPDGKWWHRDSRGGTRGECLKAAILAIPTDQSALDRHDVELLTVGPCGKHPKLFNTFDGLMQGENGPHRCMLCVENAELKAQTAAMLEKAAESIATVPYVATTREYVDTIHALIPTDYAAALADNNTQVRNETLHGLATVLGIKSDNLDKWDTWEKFVAACVRQAVQEEAEWWAEWGMKEGQAEKRLSHVRAAAGAPEETK